MTNALKTIRINANCAKRGERMRLIDAEVLEKELERAIMFQEAMAKTLGIDDDEAVQAELKAYKDILNGVKEQPTIKEVATE